MSDSYAIKTSPFYVHAIHFRFLEYIDIISADDCLCGHETLTNGNVLICEFLFSLPVL